jgi:hypothetical protein
MRARSREFPDDAVACAHIRLYVRELRMPNQRYCRADEFDEIPRSILLTPRPRKIARISHLLAGQIVWKAIGVPLPQLYSVRL